ncbi:Taste receptor type 1 member 2, partial [Eschrichtius robustus]|nr:Taste receptor type 1 member 2 [Eschrichtius robustus]
MMVAAVVMVMVVAVVIVKVVVAVILVMVVVVVIVVMVVVVIVMVTVMVVVVVMVIIVMVVVMVMVIVMVVMVKLIVVMVVVVVVMVMVIVMVVVVMMKVLGYNLMQATHFAVEEISNDISLLPSVLLGYEMVDTCYMSNNVHPVLYFLSQDDYFPPIQEDYSHYVPRVVATTGPDNSESSMTVAHFLSLSLLPQLRFPAVLRTAPGVHHQVEAMVQLMLHFRWNGILVLPSSDDYGRGNSQLLSERLAHCDICIAFQETLPMPQPDQTMTQQEPERLEAIVGKLQQSVARAVAVFSPDLALFDFFREVLRQNFTGAVWIASESWAIDPVLHHLTQLQRTGTFLGTTTQSVPIPGFSEFRVRRSQVSRPALNRSSLGATCNQECDTCMNTTESFNSILTLSGERVVYSVYSAIYAVAHAPQNLLGCNQTGCHKEVVYPWQLLPEIWKVNFTLLGHQIFFNEQGDLSLKLEVIQWQWHLSQNPFQSIASYQPSKRQLKDICDISWHTPNSTLVASLFVGVLSGVPAFLL